MSDWSFTIPGQPIPKGRPKHMKNGHTYTPARTVQAEVNVGLFFRQANPGYGPPKAGRMTLSCVFYMRRDDADGDNLIKMVMDGLQGIAYLNDRQVKVGSWDVRLDRDNPRTEVILSQ